MRIRGDFFLFSLMWRREVVEERRLLGRREFFLWWEAHGV
jgi:hypothetical protein